MHTPGRFNGEAFVVGGDRAQFVDIGVNVTRYEEIDMLGWLRYPSRDFAGRTNAGNQNHFVSEPGAGGTVKAVVFDRLRPGNVSDDWDGQFAIATLESPGVEVSYQTTYIPDRGGNEVWAPFSKDGRLANDSANWVSSGETLAGAIAVRFTLKPGEKKVVPMATPRSSRKVRS